MKEFEISTKIRIYDNPELAAPDHALIDAAKEAALNSYAPYSNFHVGAAVRMADGRIITGNNQENAAFPSGLCAERTAMFYACSQAPSCDIAAIAVAAQAHGHYTENPVPPCGACRQAMLEAEERSGHSIRILLYSESGTYEIPSVKSLLPLQFKGETMKE